jgi:hypothetical protein
LFSGKEGEFPGGALCILTYMSVAWDKPDAAGGQKSSLINASLKQIIHEIV